jgi:phosphoglucomutase
MTLHSLAGQPVPADRVPDIDALVGSFHDARPDPDDPAQRVSFGTSGHRGSSLDRGFNEDHIAAICQAIVEHRQQAGITGPLFLGRDTHALSEPAMDTALAVLAANGVQLMLDSSSPYTPTPVLSWAILCHNRGNTTDLADGVIITPSHNPPEDGGLKYNPPTGGPADADITGTIEARANELLEAGLRGVRRGTVKEARESPVTYRRGLRDEYVADLGAVLDLPAIRSAGLRIGVDPLGGASVGYWEQIADRHGLDIEVVNPQVDPAFSFMHLDWDGKIRMDCSSPHAMAGLIGMKDRFDVAVGLDPDADRHGIVTPTAGLLNPNHYLAAAIHYLFTHRPWSVYAGIGKTIVSSSMIDRVAADLDRELVEVPVGFKWFVDGLRSGGIAFGGEESAGASFLRRDETAWTTDKDGILLCLLAAEMTAKTGRDPGELYADLEGRFGTSTYERIDAPATAEQKAVLKALSPEAVAANRLGGEEIIARLTRAPGNDAPIGGLKVVTENGWFAARPSGTEDVYKIYAESFRGPDHLRQIQDDAREIVDAAFRAALS